jgi:hypothetical protein
VQHFGAFASKWQWKWLRPIISRKRTQRAFTPVFQGTKIENSLEYNINRDIFAVKSQTIVVAYEEKEKRNFGQLDR